MITYHDFAQAFSLFYGLLFLMLVGLAVSFFKPRWQRIVAVLVVTGFVAWPIVDRALEIAGKRQYAEDAWAHFNKLCKEKAGIKVYKTVEGVESVMLMKPRPTVGPDEIELFDQYWKGDQYGGIAWQFQEQQ